MTTSLEDLLKESIALRQEEKRVKADQGRLRDSRLSSKERDAINAKVREWESSHEYRAVGIVFVQTRFVCKGCGVTHLAGGQMMQDERHVRMAGTTRRIPAPMPHNASLPRTADSFEVVIQICGACAPERGFP